MNKSVLQLTLEEELREANEHLKNATINYERLTGKSCDYANDCYRYMEYKGIIVEVIKTALENCILINKNRVIK